MSPSAPSKFNGVNYIFQILQGAASDGPVLQADGEGLFGQGGRGEHGEGEGAQLLRDRAALPGQQRHLPLLHLGVSHSADLWRRRGPTAHLGNVKRIIFAKST